MSTSQEMFEDMRNQIEQAIKKVNDLMKERDSLSVYAESQAKLIAKLEELVVTHEKTISDLKIVKLETPTSTPTQIQTDLNGAATVVVSVVTTVTPNE